MIGPKRVDIVDDDWWRLKIGRLGPRTGNWEQTEGRDQSEPTGMEKYSEHQAEFNLRCIPLPARFLARDPQQEDCCPDGESC